MLLMENKYYFVKIIEARILDLQKKLDDVENKQTENIEELLLKNKLILLHLHEGEEEYQLEN